MTAFEKYHFGNISFLKNLNHLMAAFEKYHLGNISFLKNLNYFSRLIRKSVQVQINKIIGLIY